MQGKKIGIIGSGSYAKMTKINIFFGGLEKRKMLNTSKNLNITLPI
ncbi:MAG: hypothetical protein K0R59_1773 [Sphingobacterium sp.]|nr:hypothetical protein [Sphingobacterium sp.]